MNSHTVWSRIESTTKGSLSYKDSLAKLQALPSGYKFLFSLHYVDADILNGGFNQLHQNSTWALIVTAIEAAKAFGFPRWATLLKSVVYYYHRKGRSRLKRQIGSDYFSDIDTSSVQSFQELEDEYFEFSEQLYKDPKHKDLWDVVIKRLPSLFA